MSDGVIGESLGEGRKRDREREVEQARAGFNVDGKHETLKLTY